MIISLVCAIQCALAPIVLSIAPIIPQWAHFGHGWVWISIILIIVVWSIGRGIQKHGNKKVAIFAAIGVVLLMVGNLLEGRISIVIESIIFVSGGRMLALAHWRNFKLERAIDS